MSSEQHEMQPLGAGRFQVAPAPAAPEEDEEGPLLDGGDSRSATKSLGQLTREVVPRAENYRNLASLLQRQGLPRPTLEELHAGHFVEKMVIQVEENGGVGTRKRGKVIKFGWLEGVYMRCLLNIWGVMLFLRLSWVVGQSGIAEGLLVICLANVVTLITTLSMSAVSTNGQIKAGGIYYLISRSLGPEFGGAIGLMFTLANSIAVAMYIVGFCESLRDLLRTFEVVVIDDGINDIRVVGLGTLFAILILALVGMDWVTRTQIFLLAILVLSQVDFMIGTFLGPKSEEERLKGFVGYKLEVFQSNLWSSYQEQEGIQHDFFSVFAIFFPAVTGIVAGANLSGDLKDPSSAIPLGTLLAIITTFLSYVLYAVMMGGCVLREAMGNTTALLENGTAMAANCSGQQCHFGLLHDTQAMTLSSAWGPLIYGGCFAATLSSAIASLVGAPRVLQALASDHLYPFIGFFAKGFGANNDPVRGYVLVFFISVGCILIGELNAIAPLLSNFFLAAYALINLSAFHASATKSPGWRPAFKYYSAWASLLGGGLCIVVMFLISWWMALITFLVVIILYLYVSYRRPDVNWGSSTQAQSYLTALRSAYALSRVEDHVKNFRPQLLVLSGMPGSRPPLLDVANLVTRNLSLLVAAHVVPHSLSQRARAQAQAQAARWMHHHKVKGFFVLSAGESFERAVLSLSQLVGLGKLRPNVLLMGYKRDWQDCEARELKQYFHAIHIALDSHMAVAILRVNGPLDFSAHLQEEDAADRNEADDSLDDTSSGGSSPSIRRTLSSASTDGGEVSANPQGELEHAEGKTSAQGPGERPLRKEVLNAITQFQRKQKKGHLDVWWLYDDGGLTLLLPYILSTRSQFSDCKLRVFSLASKRGELDQDQRNLAGLLSKFRINYSDVVLIPDITRKAKDSTRRELEALLEKFRPGDHGDKVNEDPELYVSDSELADLMEKTNRHMRLREELLLHSKESTFVVVTLPIPRRGGVSAPLYMAWLELLTRDMPPTLLVRGNQTSVLTFYS